MPLNLLVCSYILSSFLHKILQFTRPRNNCLLGGIHYNIHTCTSDTHDSSLITLTYYTPTSDPFTTPSLIYPMPQFPPHPTSAPKLIEGVLVNRKVLREPEVRFECHMRFEYHRYTIPLSALSCPKTHSPCIPMLHQLLGIRIFHIPTTNQTPWPADLSDTPCFFGYWPSADRWRSKYSRALRGRSMVFFRNDLKPLHPKQMEALWSFCDRLCLVITPPLLLEYMLPGRLASLRWEFKMKVERPVMRSSSEFQFEKMVGLIQGI